MASAMLMLRQLPPARAPGLGQVGFPSRLQEVFNRQKVLPVGGTVPGTVGELIEL